MTWPADIRPDTTSSWHRLWVRILRSPCWSTIGKSVLNWLLSLAERLTSTAILERACERNDPLP